jgi:tRNA(fMet)-specific endonuclease VapC
MKYLLDTNACIAIINGDPAKVRSRFQIEVQRNSELFVSSVAAFEMWFGVTKSARVSENTRLLQTFLGGRVVPLAFDMSDARSGGEIRATLERAGRPIGSYDLLLAGQAVNRGLTIVTANEREFRRVSGLRWENWA